MSLPTDREPARPRSRSAGRLGCTRLGILMAVVSLAGLPLASWAVVDLLRSGLGIDVVLLSALVLVLVIGELIPIEISRRGRVSDEITISTTFALALLFLAPLGWVVLAQALPLIFDDLRRKKHWTRPVFNTAQYALTFVAARGAFCLLTGKDFWAPSAFSAADLPASFAAGAVFFAVNHVCVSTAIAFKTGEPVLLHLRDDIRLDRKSVV